MDWISLINIHSHHKTREERFNSLFNSDKKFKECVDKTFILFFTNTSGKFCKDYLLTLYDSLDYMDSRMREHEHMYPSPPSYFQNMYDSLEYKIVNNTEKTNGMDLSKYKEKLGMTYKEIANGYSLYNVEDNTQIFTVKDFLKLNKLLFSEDINISYDEFVEILEDKCCTDWYKEDVNGECYGGYWAYPEGSYEKENARDLTFKSQCDGLWNLPYPKQMIIEMIEHACCRRIDNVRGVNCLCEWVKRKSRQIMIDDV